MTSRNQLKHFVSLCSSFQCCTLGATAEGEAGTGAAFRGWAAGFAGSASEGAGSAGGAAEGAAQGRDREPAGPTKRRAGGAAIRTAGAGKCVSGWRLVLRFIFTFDTFCSCPYQVQQSMLVYVWLWTVLSYLCDHYLFESRPQIEEIRDEHETSLMEIEMAHNDTLATLQEEHARTVKSKHWPVLLSLTDTLCCRSREIIIICYYVSDLKMAHEQQTKSLEEEFEKIRLSLQVNASLFFNRYSVWYI